jgi:hypothetical protein
MENGKKKKREQQQRIHATYMNAVENIKHNEILCNYVMIILKKEKIRSREHPPIAHKTEWSAFKAKKVASCI